MKKLDTARSVVLGLAMFFCVGAAIASDMLGFILASIGLALIVAGNVLNVIFVLKTRKLKSQEQ